MSALSSKSILTKEAELFIEQWYDKSPYIEAYTSGSTGPPKPIRLLKDDMRASARATLKFFSIDANSALLLPLSPDYIAGKMQIVRAIEAGCTLIAEPPSSRPFQEYAGRCTLIPIVPAQLQSILTSDSKGDFENILIGGSPLPPQLEASAISAGINAYVSYGMTETCSHVALRRIGQRHYTGLDGFTFATSADNRLIIESTTLSFGTLTTNDIVSLHDAHSFEWLGRADNVINSGGIKIHPELIETTLLPLLPDSVTAYVTARSSARYGEEAVIVCDSPCVSHSILSMLAEMLPKYHTPKDIIYIEQIPRTSSGKIIRQRFT